MTQILTVTLNPALDLSTSASKVTPGPKLRCAAPRAEPGGGGVNVARAIALLGGQARALVALGGSTGALYRSLLGDLEVVTLDAPGETRQSLSVTDQESGEQYRFVLPGPEWSGEDLERLVAALERQSMAGDLIVLSGSLPPGAPAEFPLDLARALSGRRVVLDTSGQALAQAARGERADLELLRMDSHEARELSGQGLQRMDESADFARALVCSGAARAVIIACGKDGSVMADASGLWRVNAANTHVVSAVGAGDSFVGGFVRAVALGEAAHEALRQGAAAAAAACLSEGSQLCRPEDFTRMLRHTQAVRSGEL